VSSEKRDDPHVTTTFAPSVVTSTGRDGRLREMSASRRPLTSATPGSLMSAAISTRPDTS
jgi:hypothetical protein